MKNVKKPVISTNSNVPYSDEYKEMVFILLDNGKSKYSIQKELGVKSSTISLWMSKKEINKSSSLSKKISKETEKQKLERTRKELDKATKEYIKAIEDYHRSLNNSEFCIVA